MSIFERAILAASLTPILLLAAGCEDHDPMGLAEATGDANPVVFDDDWGGDVYFQPFFETHYTAVTRDSVFAFDASDREGVGFAPDGARSLKVQIPAPGSALGPYSGGVFTSAGARDLRGYNALTLYVRSNADGLRLGSVGFGNDNTGASLYEASRGVLTPMTLSRDWELMIIPIPDPSKLISERGLFQFAQAPEDLLPDGLDIWFDEIRFTYRDDVRVVASAFSSRAVGHYFTGMTVGAGGAQTAFSTSEGQIWVEHSTAYFDLASSAPAVARPASPGQLEIVGEGEAVISGKMRGEDVRTTVALVGHAPPDQAAPAPTHPANEVVSLHSAFYDDIPVETWRADWEKDGATTQVQDLEVGGRPNKVYYNLNFVGIDLGNRLADAEGMGYFHLDVYAPTGTAIALEFLSYPAGFGDPVGAALRFDGSTTPAFAAGGWTSLDIPLENFPVSPTFDWGRIGIIVLSAADADVPLMLVDNVYWHK